MTFLPPDPVPVRDLGFSTAEATWLGVPSAERQITEAVAAGLGSGASADVVTLSSGAVASAGALRRFVRASEGSSGDVVGVLAEPLGRWSRDPALGPAALMVRLRGGGDLSPERVRAAARVEVPVDHRPFPVRLADTPGGRTAEIPVADAILCNTSVWPGLLWANLLGLAPELLATLVGPPWQAPLRFAWAWMRTRTTDPMVLAGALSRFGRGARVHPTAVVEASWVGEGAAIGPGAIVRGAIVGPGAVIEAQALAQFVVLGAGAHIQRRGFAQFAVIHPGASVAGALQMAVVGPGASVKHGATLLDQSLGAEVRAEVDGQLHPAPLGVLGVGVGAHTIVASGVQVAAGRTLPSGVSVLPGAGEVLRRIPRGIQGPCEVRDGTLVQR